MPGSPHLNAPLSRHGVVLIGQLDWPQNIYLAHTLHAAGLEVHFISDGPQPRELASWLKITPVAAHCPTQMAQQLARLDADPGIGWILPLDERAIAQSHDALPHSDKLYPRLNASQHAVLATKSAMSRFAASVGVRVPRSVHFAGAAEGLRLAESFGYPVVLKGEAGHAGSQVAICRHADELQAALHRMGDLPCFLQQHVAGRNWACGGFFVRGEPARLQAYEIITQQPVESGPASVIRHVWPNEMIEALMRLAKALSWNGYLQADFIRCAQGDFHFLEINPRPWGSMTAALAAGNDIFEPMVDTLLGRLPEQKLDHASGWSGFIFPKPLMGYARDKQIVPILKTVFSPSFWRSAPATDPSILRYFLKQIYWEWRAGSPPAQA